MFNKKRKYFNWKLNAVQKMIWDMEFKREKTLMIREGIRNEYDAIQSKLHIVNTQIEALPVNKEKWTDEQKRLDDQKILLIRDSERLVNQMKSLDLEVYGSKKTNEYPEGVDGIDQQLDALRELQAMIKGYIKSL